MKYENRMDQQNNVNPFVIIPGPWGPPPPPPGPWGPWYPRPGWGPNPWRRPGWGPGWGQGPWGGRRK